MLRTSKETLINILKELNDSPNPYATKEELVNRLKYIVLGHQDKEMLVMEPHERIKPLPKPINKPHTEPIKTKSLHENIKDISEKSLNKWVNQFSLFLENGNSGCIRYSSVNIFLDNIPSNLIPTYKYKKDTVNVNIEFHGESETAKIYIYNKEIPNKPQKKFKYITDNYELDYQNITNLVSFLMKIGKSASKVFITMSEATDESCDINNILTDFFRSWCEIKDIKVTIIPDEVHSGSGHKKTRKLSKK